MQFISVPENQRRTWVWSATSYSTTLPVKHVYDIVGGTGTGTTVTFNIRNELSGLDMSMLQSAISDLAISIGNNQLTVTYRLNRNTLRDALAPIQDYYKGIEFREFLMCDGIVYEGTSIAICRGNLLATIMGAPIYDTRDINMALLDTTNPSIYFSVTARDSTYINPYQQVWGLKAYGHSNLRTELSLPDNFMTVWVAMGDLPANSTWRVFSIRFNNVPQLKQLMQQYGALTFTLDVAAASGSGITIEYNGFYVPDVKPPEIPPYIRVTRIGDRLQTIKFDTSTTQRYAFEVRVDPKNLTSGAQTVYMFGGGTVFTTGFYIMESWLDNTTGQGRIVVGVPAADLIQRLQQLVGNLQLIVIQTVSNGTVTVSDADYFEIRLEGGEALPPLIVPPGEVTPTVEVFGSKRIIVKEDDTGTILEGYQVVVNRTDITLWNITVPLSYRIFRYLNNVDITQLINGLLSITYTPTFGTVAADLAYKFTVAYNVERIKDICKAFGSIIIEFNVPWFWTDNVVRATQFSTVIGVRKTGSGGSKPPVLGGDSDPKDPDTEWELPNAPITQVGSSGMVQNQIDKALVYRRMYYKTALDPQDSYDSLDYVISLNNWYRKKRYPERWQRVSADDPTLWFSDDNKPSQYTGGVSHSWYQPGGSAVYVENPITEFYLQDKKGNYAGTNLQFYLMPWGSTLAVTKQEEWGAAAYKASGLVFYQDKTWLQSQLGIGALHFNVEYNKAAPQQLVRSRPYVTRLYGKNNSIVSPQPPELLVERTNTIAYMTDLPSVALQTDLTKWYVSEMIHQKLDTESDNNWYSRWVPILKYPTEEGDWIIHVDDNGNVTYEEMGDINNTSYNFQFLWGENNDGSTTYLGYTYFSMVLPKSNIIPLASGEAWLSQQLYNNGATTISNSIWFSAGRSTTNPLGTTNVASVGYPIRCWSTNGTTFISINEGGTQFQRHTLLQCKLITYSN